MLILEPTVHKVDDGFFFESFNRRDFAEATGLDVSFIQDNHSLSERHVLVFIIRFNTLKVNSFVLSKAPF